MPSGLYANDLSTTKASRDRAAPYSLECDLESAFAGKASGFTLFVPAFMDAVARYKSPDDIFSR